MKISLYSRVISYALLFLLASAFWLLAAAGAGEWCAKPIGAGTRDAMWASMQPLLAEMRKLAGGHDFAIISTPKRSTIAGEAGTYRESFRRAYIDSFLSTEAEHEQTFLHSPELAPFAEPGSAEQEAEVDQVMAATDNRYARGFVRIAIAAAGDAAKKEASKRFDEASGDDSDFTDRTSSGATLGVTYVYSTSRHFREQVDIEGIERGATLLTEGNELEQEYERPEGFADLLKGVKFVFIDNITPGVSSSLEGPNRVLLRLPALKNGAYVDIAELVHGDPQKRFKAFSLLPETESAATPWGLDTHLTRSYAAAGVKIARQIRKSGMERGNWKDAASLAAAIEKAVADGFKPILIGEAAEDGRVRLAGLSDVFDPETLSEAARKASFFLFCNSSMGAANRTGFSVEGRIYLNAVAEMLGTLGASEKTENSREHANAENEWVRALVHTLAAASKDGTQTLDVYQFKGRPPQPSPTPTPPAPDQGSIMPGLLFFYGAFGGLCIEFTRWRALLKRPRGPQFVTPVFIAVSAAFVLPAGGVGFIFGRLAPSDVMQTVSAFIAGVGFDEIIKRASRLKSPNVPFGKSGVRASLHEFLAG